MLLFVSPTVEYYAATLFPKCRMEFFPISVCTGTQMLNNFTFTLTYPQLLHTIQIPYKYHAFSYAFLSPTWIPCRLITSYHYIALSICFLLLYIFILLYLSCGLSILYLQVYIYLLPPTRHGHTPFSYAVYNYIYL